MNNGVFFINIFVFMFVHLKAMSVVKEKISQTFSAIDILGNEYFFFIQIKRVYVLKPDSI